MTQYEMVEKLREKANVSYEEAKAALEASNWDLLDAMVLLEKQGKMGSEHVQYSTEAERVEPEREERHHHRHGSFAQGMGKFGRFIANLVHRGNENSFEVSRKDEKVLTLSVTSLVLIFLIMRMWWFVALLVVGLFFGFRYTFRGPSMNTDAVNSAMARASDVVDEMKRSHCEGDGENKN